MCESVQCSCILLYLQSLQAVLVHLRSLVGSFQCALFYLQCSICTVLRALFYGHCAMCTVLWAVSSVQCSVFSVQEPIYSLTGVQFTLCIVHFKQTAWLLLLCSPPTHCSSVLKTRLRSNSERALLVLPNRGTEKSLNDKTIKKYKDWSTSIWSTFRFNIAHSSSVLSNIPLF